MEKPKPKLGYRATLDALKAHANKAPGVSEDEIDALARAVDEETDRGAVILLATAFEDKLTDAIKSHMRHNLNSDQRKRLFGYDAPLGTFSAKIMMGYAVGILNKEMLDVAEIVREMRNACAHSRSAISFQDEALANPIRLICQLTDYEGLKLDDPAPMRFILLLFINWLIVNLFKKRKKNPETHVSDLLRSYARYTLAKQQSSAQTLSEPLPQESL